MTTAQTDATAQQSNDFTTSVAVSAAEKLMNKMESLSAEGVAAVEELTNHLSESAPSSGNLSVNVTGTAEQYYPLMYFVEKARVGNATTCGGTTSHVPLVGSLDM